MEWAIWVRWFFYCCLCQRIWTKRRRKKNEPLDKNNHWHRSLCGNVSFELIISCIYWTSICAGKHHRLMLSNCSIGNSYVSHEILLPCFASHRRHASYSKQIVHATIWKHLRLELNVENKKSECLNKRTNAIDGKESVKFYTFYEHILNMRKPLNDKCSDFFFQISPIFDRFVWICALKWKSTW